MAAIIGPFVLFYLVVGTVCTLVGLQEISMTGWRWYGSLVIRIVLWFPLLLLTVIMTPFDVYRDYRLRRSAEEAWREELRRYNAEERM